MTGRCRQNTPTAESLGRFILKTWFVFIAIDHESAIGTVSLPECNDLSPQRDGELG